MKYINAQQVLPKQLIETIQTYIDGEYLYIPTQARRKSWGEASGSRQMLAARNQEIFRRYQRGECIRQLAKVYYLSESSIRKIIKREKNK
ncbi:MAG: CD3324 family protein [Cellulosilyticaceae bacterium]